jgi:hypothetical protein
VLHALLLQHPRDQHLQGDSLELQNAVPKEHGAPVLLEECCVKVDGALRVPMRLVELRPTSFVLADLIENEVETAPSMHLRHLAHQHYVFLAQEALVNLA